MKNKKNEIELSERPKQPISHGVSFALVSTLICAGKLFKSIGNRKKIDVFFYSKTMQLI